MLMSIGFAVAGQHRSKPVTLFRQGGAAIVINRDESHFAHSYNIAHGASICATGIVVGDSASALRRAQAIGIATLPDSEETPLVGMHGPGGDLVYLIDADGVEALWASEFEIVGDGSGVSGTPICGYDHASAAMLPTEFLGAQSFWTTMFDLDSAPLVNVADPSGLIESRALLKEGSGLRVTINSSAAQNTLTNRYVGRSFGASIQHIAMASTDIWQTAAMLVERGAELLDIPANYYDDIAARFVLDADFVERLRAHNILYDRDAEGDYFQLYTRAFDRRFFLEFVQRRSGYRGFGAPNASIRLAAQARYRVPTELAL